MTCQSLLDLRSQRAASSRLGRRHWPPITEPQGAAHPNGFPNTLGHLPAPWPRMPRTLRARARTRSARTPHFAALRGTVWRLNKIEHTRQDIHIGLVITLL